MENERAVGPSTRSFHLEKTSLTEHSSAHNNTHPTFIKYRVKTKKIVHYISLFHCWSLDVIIWHQQDRLWRLYNQVWWQFPESPLGRDSYYLCICSTPDHNNNGNQANKLKKKVWQTKSKKYKSNKQNVCYIWSPSHNLCNHWASPTQHIALSVVCCSAEPCWTVPCPRSLL